VLKKRKPAKRFPVVEAVKAAAREHIGTPPPTRRDPDKSKPAKPKHKPTLSKLLSDEGEP
jgi:hypothetical protein